MSTPTNERLPLLLIGRKEHLDLPEWGVRRLRVKIDTGARTSAMHVEGYDLEENGGKVLARIRVPVGKGDSEKTTEVMAPVVRMTNVTSTCGGRERRPVVEATVRLGPVRKRINVTLTDRSAMRNRMILGREALAGTFLVDVGRKYLLRPSRPRTE